MYGNRYMKRKTPYGVFFFLLLVCLTLGYFMSGLYKLEGISILNLEEGLVYVFEHPLDNWSSKTPACLGLAFLAWMLLAGYIMYYYRNFHLATEHGSADWLDAQTACNRLADKEEKNNRILTENLKVSLEGSLPNNNMLVIGSSGLFKTTSVMHQNMLQFGSSYIVLDVKGDTQRKLGKAMQRAGYTIKSVNFKNPRKSDRINPFVYIENENDLLRIIKTLHDACRPQKEASMADPFWDDAVDLYLQSLFYYVWLDGRDKGRTGTMNDVTALCNLESQKTVCPETGEEISALQQLMNQKAEKYGPNYPPVRDYGKLKDGATDTVRSVILMINGMLRICETAEVKRIFSDNDINIREVGTGVGGDPEKKMVIFLVIPDNNNAYNWIVSMFYTQMFDILIRLSDDELNSPLPVRVEFFLDEFYAGAKPVDSDVLLGVVRSRNISMIVYLQSIAQIKTLFKDAKWETIMDNISTVLYLGSGPTAEGTHKFISDVLGKATIDSRSDNVHRGNNGNSGINFNRTGRELMMPEEVKRMSPTEAIVFLSSHPPIYDTKAIPFNVIRMFFRAEKKSKRRYKEATALGPYEHPVYTVYDPVHFHYITVQQDKRLQVLTDKKEIQTYWEAAKKDPHIYVYNIDEQDLLYLNWGQADQSPEEVEKLFRGAMEAEQRRIEDIRGLAVLQDVDEKDVPDFGTEAGTDKSGWKQSGSLKNLLNVHWDDLTELEQEEVCLGIDDGLTEEQLCHLMLLPYDQMAVWRRACVLENGAG